MSKGGGSVWFSLQFTCFDEFDCFASQRNEECLHLDLANPGTSSLAWTDEAICIDKSKFDDDELSFPDFDCFISRLKVIVYVPND